jgi:hypothetical protein
MCIWHAKKLSFLLTSHGYKQNEISQETWEQKSSKQVIIQLLRAFSFKKIKLTTVALQKNCTKYTAIKINIKWHERTSTVIIYIYSGWYMQNINTINYQAYDIPVIIFYF